MSERNEAIDLLGLSGKRAIIWGGAQGMGASSVMHLARAGCDVAIVDIDLAAAKEVADLVIAMGRNATALRADVTDEEHVTQAVAAAAGAIGPLDSSVSVVGRGIFKPLMDLTEEEWGQQHDFNLKSMFYISRAVARHMLRHGQSGSITSICSISGTTSAPWHAPYGAAKAGMANLVKSMAMEWGPRLRVNAIAPGTITTGIRPPIAGEGTDQDPFRQRLAMERRGTVDEVGGVALFLASRLASYVTGQTIQVDGGWTAAWLFNPHIDNVGITLPRDTDRHPD